MYNVYNVKTFKWKQLNKNFLYCKSFVVLFILPFKWLGF